MKDLRSKNKTRLIMSTIQLAKSGPVLQNSSFKTPLFFFSYKAMNDFFWQRIHIQLLIVSSIFHSSSFLSNTDDVHVWWLSIVKTTEKLATIYGTPIYQQARHGCPDKVWQLNKMLSILCPNINQVIKIQSWIWVKRSTGQLNREKKKYTHIHK